MDELTDKIAIIGMACRFPGANSVDQYWDLLRSGKSAIKEFSREELIAIGIDADTLDDPDYVKAGAWLDDADCFDASFFGYNPREAAMMDPQHRVFLECASAALDDAGIVTGQDSIQAGVFGGIARNTYMLDRFSANPEMLHAFDDYQSMLSSEKDYIATRVAFKLNLTGPAIDIQTACSSSGVAVHLACQSLLAGDCHIALAGGGRIQVPLHSGYLYQEGGTQSPDGYCRAFDADAKGMVRGSGMGFIVLKRLEEAITDGDSIHAVIRATAINNDGSDKVGFTAPGLKGQAAVIGDALALADIDADDIGYIETHGTGTALGDPIEIAALTHAYREFTDKKAYCPVGSVKTSIGHLDAGASIAGLIKTILALKYAEIPASLNYTRPNPQIDFDNSPFYVNAKTAPWSTEQGSRYAGISSFGLGGTNFHAILENWTDTRESSDSRAWQLIPLSAKTQQSLSDTQQQLSDYLGYKSDLSLADVAYTLQKHRRTFTCRSYAVVSNTSEAETYLLEQDNWSAVVEQDNTRDDYIFMFSGQGAQYANMGRGLYDAEPVYREQIDRCALYLQDILGCDIRELLYPEKGMEDQAAEQLQQTRFTQPALFVTGYAMSQLWMVWGIRPAAMIGHSIGEYVAACLSGVFTLEQALKLVAERGRLMQQQEPGTMLAVSLPEDQLDELLAADISVAAINSANTTVVSGPVESILDLQKSLQQNSVSCQLLRTSHAYHSEMMDGVLEPFEQLLKSLKPARPAIPFVSNLTGDWISDEQATDPHYWVKHLRHTVRFYDGLSVLLDKENASFIEMGPGRTLCNFVRQHPLRQDAHIVINSIRHPKEQSEDQACLLSALGQVWAAGGSVDWDQYYQYEQRKHVSVPGYAFERTRYWIEGDSKQQRSATALQGQQDITGSSQRAEESAGSPPETSQTVGQILKKILVELSGLPAEQIKAKASFLELGFDSLALTQVSLALKKRFSVNITFRQVMEELGSLETLTGYIKQNWTEPEISGLTEESTTEADEPPSHTVTASELMATDEPEITTGPWKAIETKQTSGLTEQQQQHLAALIERIVSRTPATRQLVQTNRQLLADARTVSGFRRLWKEIVYPVVAERSQGSRLWDIDGNEYIDMAMGFGVNLFGHSPEFVTKAVQKQLHKGYEIGPQTPLAGEVASLFCEMTGMQRMAFCNTGSEAVLAAIRVARTVTARDKIVIFAGSYHGIFDEVLVKRLTIGGRSRPIPVAPGILPQMVEQVIVLDYGNDKSLDVIREQAANIAAVLVEPVQSRHPDTQPVSFLRELREVTRELDIALVFDEMITGFRSHPGGVQALFDIKADIATYGKVIGGGLPIGIVSGDHHYMDALDGGMWQFGDNSIPEAGVTWFAGTFVRHPLALAACRAVLLHLREQGANLQQELGRKTQNFVNDLNGSFLDMGVPLHVETFSSFFHIKYTSHQEYSTLLYYHLRDKGIHITEGRSSFFSTAHTDQDFDTVKQAILESVNELQQGGFLPSSVRPASQATEQALTDGQMEVWLACCLGDNASCAYNLSNTLRLGGPLDQEKLNHVLMLMVNRHDALRMTVSQEGRARYGEYINELDIPYIDLQDLPSVEQQARLSAAADKDVDTAYDLENGPLIRLCVYRLAEQEYVLFLGVHHIACDGWSSGVLLRDLGDLYTAQFTGVLPPEPMQFREYANWLQHEPQQQQSTLDRQYWVTQHTDMAPALDLPADHARPPIKTYQSDRVTLPVTDKLATQLRQLASKQKVTLFSLLLSVFNTLIYRLSNQHEFNVGMSAAGQTLVGIRDLVGHCVNFLPLRIKVDQQQSFIDMLASTQSTVLESFEHQLCTYGTVIGDLEFPHDPGRLPLISVVFNIDQLASDIHFENMQVTQGSNARHFETFELFFNIVLDKDQIKLECTYNKGLFDQQTIMHWQEIYIHLLQSVVEQPDIKPGKISLLTEPEYRKIIVDWNQTDSEYPANKCIHHLISEQAVTRPDKIAVSDTHRELSYRELDQRSSQLARYLQEQGISNGTLVGLSVSRSVEMLVSLLAIVKSGAAYVPLDPEFPEDRLNFMIQDSGLQYLLADTRSMKGLPVDNLQVINLDTDQSVISKNSTDLPGGAKTAPDALAYIIYTSGSTGKPKGVMVPHRSVVNFLCSMQTQPGMTEHDRLMALTTLSFDIAVLELYLPLISGASLYIVDAEDAADGSRLAKRLEQYNPTIMQATPGTWRMLIGAAWAGSSKLKILCGGEAMPADLVSELYNKSASVWNMYGPTETTVWSTCYQIPGPDSPICIGRPINNTRIYILDQAMQPLPYGVPGELYIGGDGVSKGYLNRPELTEERYIQNPLSSDRDILYRTGDEAKYLADGNIEFYGRLDSQVKIRGYRIELGEIESILNKHESVLESVVTIHDVHAGDRRLVAYYAPDGEVSLTSTDLRSFLNQFLPKYMLPQIFVELTAIPKTPNGKIDRKKLPEPFVDNGNNFEEVAEVLSAAEAKLAEIWQSLLFIDNIRQGDNFFDLGGHSLLAMQVINRVRNEMQANMTLLDLVLNPLSDIAAGLDVHQGKDAATDNIKQSVFGRVRKYLERFMN